MCVSACVCVCVCVFVRACVVVVLLVVVVVEIKWKKKSSNQRASTPPLERQTAPEIYWTAIRGVVGLLHLGFH